jgi:hypothetical protein
VVVVDGDPLDEELLLFIFIHLPPAVLHCADVIMPPFAAVAGISWLSFPMQWYFAFAANAGVERNVAAIAAIKYFFMCVSL